jgi:putative inorganic carbon (hco3(-)) transporter
MPPTDRLRSRRSVAARPLDAIARMHVAAVTAILAWGVLTFGAVYPWGYQPLAVACLLLGVAVLTRRRVRRSLPLAVVVSLSAIVVAGLVQEVRIPADVLQRVSPATVDLLGRYDLSFALQGGKSAHALTVDPARTWTGLFLLGSFGVFWMGLAGTLDDRVIARIVQAVVAIGFVIALLAMVLSGDHSGKVYGFWQPHSPGLPFGPFVNRNHYAGWMLMATLVGFGYFIALLAEAGRDGGRSWRQRIMWLSTRESSRLVMVGVALAAMTMSVLLSMSRSGIACLALGLVAIGFLTGKKLLYGWARTALVTGLIAFGAASFGWAGTDAMAARFGTWQDDSLDGRVSAWRDAGQLVRQFPLAGTGLNTFGVAMLFYQSTHLQELYAEAHNDYLQLAAEGGVLVGVPVLALICFTAMEVRRRFRDTDPASPARWIRTGAVVGLLAVAIQEAGDFSLQMPGNAALFCVLAAIALYRPGTPHTR